MNQFLAEVRIALDALDPHVPGGGRQSLHDLRDAINAAFIQKAIDGIESQVGTSTRAEVNFGVKADRPRGVNEASDDGLDSFRRALSDPADNNPEALRREAEQVRPVKPGGFPVETRMPSFREEPIGDVKARLGERGKDWDLIRRPDQSFVAKLAGGQVRRVVCVGDGTEDAAIRALDARLNPRPDPDSAIAAYEPEVPPEADSIGPVPKGFGSHITTDEACS